jgi:hypothetical protein
MAPNANPPEQPTIEQRLQRRRARRQREDSREPVPWLWLGLGVLVTMIGIGAAVGLAGVALGREPLAAPPPEPTIIRLTAPPSPTLSSTVAAGVATPFPTFTPPPTPDVSVAPPAITVGYYAQVANTGKIGVSFRAGPSTDNLRLELVPEGTLGLVIEGPAEGSGFTWWQLRLADQSEGWIAGEFLVPAAGPAQDLAPATES